jgi:hypothetical protein
MLLRIQAVEFVCTSGVVQISPKAGALPGQVEVFENPPFDLVGAQDHIQINIEAVLGLVEEHPPPRHLVVLHLPQMDMGALHRLPIGIMIIRAVDTLAIVHPISDWHPSHDEVALIHPENPDVSAHDVLP